ncbi:selenium metabolism-associated LysR family transcriptional regulator [Thermodesulfovibrio sp.]|uniref:selenium metabolism-associated LysR family transcriptional regulator n=1 Tax=Thermodesulfovibrio sp. TaxID=2067987 RepID=UPI0030A37AF0
MDIHQLKIFIAVFKNRSFSKAGKELYLTQPTISEHIKTLENELELKLFDRVGKTVIPTKDAQILYEQALEIVEKIELIKDSIQKIKTVPSGSLSIGASSIPGTYILPELISTFNKKYPQIFLHILISDSKSVIESLISGEILIGVVGTAIKDPRIKYEPFMNDELVIATPYSFKKSYISPKELSEYPFIMREEGSGTRKEMEKWLSKIGVNLDNLMIVCTLGSTDAVKEAIKKGVGISILSIHSIKDEIECKRLKAVKIDNYEMKRVFYIARNPKRSLPFVHQLFYDFLKEKAFTV